MQTLSIEQTKAISAYEQADENGKQLLKELFGEKTFLGTITDRVKSFEDACKVLGLSPYKVLPDISDEIADDAKSIRAYVKIVIITRALNEGWKPDWNDDDEPKYYPWFYMDAPGFRFGYASVGYSDSGVGSRLCLRSSELVQYAVKQFESEYKDFFTI